MSGWDACSAVKTRRDPPINTGRIDASLTWRNALSFRKHRPREEDSMMVTLTENAGEKLKVLLAEEADEGDGLRVQVVPGGCSGFEYQLTFGKPAGDDEIVEQHGVRIIIDRFSAPYLFGAEFDYEESFQGAGFIINNPNSSSSCGCGKSFQA